MSRSVLLWVLLALSLAACGGAASPQPAPAEPAQVEQPTQPPPTSTPAPTDTPEPTPTVDAAYEAAQAFAGEWTGSWLNKTFGSTGEASASISIEPDGQAEFTLDLGGMVFGMIDPDPMTYLGTFDANGARFEAPGDPLFGDLTITVDSEGQLTVTGELIPVAGIARLEALGNLSPDEIRLDYTVFFTGGGQAVGELVMTR